MNALKRRGCSLREIARELRRSVSTISDELKRNRVKGAYDPTKAHHKAYVRRKYAYWQGMKIAGNKELREFVENLLLDDQSPEAVAGRLSNQEAHLPPVSKNTVYRYIKSPYGRKIEYYRNKLRRKRKRRKPLTKPWKDRVFIDQRPEYINKRMRAGDAEADFIVSGKSGKGVVLVVAGRRYRNTYLEQIIRPTLPAITRACKRIKRRFPEWSSMTTDNDLLFQHHKVLEKKLGIKIYFCHPGHAWEKGSVENTNKYLRRYIFKSSDISRYSKRFVKSLQARTNRRIMKVLNYRTSQEMLDAYRKRKKRRGAGKH